MRLRVAVLALLATTACGGDLAFVQRGTLHAVGVVAASAPVHLPVELSWGTEDEGLAEQLGEDERYYVVFVDRAPIAPGASLLDLVGDCRPAGDCADPALFAEQGVFVSREPRLVLTTVADRRTSQRAHAPDRHLATVVVADADGVRRGDMALTLPFTIDREASS